MKKLYDLAMTKVRMIKKQLIEECKMNRLVWTSLMVCLACFSYTSTATVPDQSSSVSQPNIIILLADDLGYGDLSSYGHPSIKTPALDQLASEGQRWTNFYSVSSICSPSRGALMTGKLPVNTGLYGKRFPVMFPNAKGGIPASELTMAEALRDANYDTLMIGKWHLGDEPEALPTRHGFRDWYGLPYSNDMDWAEGEKLNTKTLIKLYETGKKEAMQKAEKEFAKRKKRLLAPRNEYWNLSLMHSMHDGDSYRDEIIEQPVEQSTLTKRYTERAVSYIKSLDSDSPPFFMYVSYSMPHVPLFASEEFVNSSQRGPYGDVIKEIDWSVGQIRRVLEEQGIAKNTLIVFSSDNGPWLWAKEDGGSAGILKGGKGTTFEGGMRVPGIFWWPGKIKQGLVEGIGSLMDVYATGLALAGQSARLDEVDAIDLTPALLGEPSPRKSFPYYRFGQLYAFRTGQYKAHFVTQGAYDSGPEYTEHEKPLLYHLGEDPSEQYNVAENRKAVLSDLIKAVNLHKVEIQKKASIFDSQ